MCSKFSTELTFEKFGFLDEARREVATLRDIVVAAEAGDSIVMTDVHQRLISVEQVSCSVLQCVAVCCRV